MILVEVRSGQPKKAALNNIRCRVINGWFKMESYIYTREKLLSEIKRIKPDVVALNLDLYARIDGIETSRMIRSRFFVPVYFKKNRSLFTILNRRIKINRKTKYHFMLGMLRLIHFKMITPVFLIPGVCLWFCGAVLSLCADSVSWLCPVLNGPGSRTLI